MDGPGSGDCLVVLTFCGLGVVGGDMSIYQSLFFLAICMGVGMEGMGNDGFSGLCLLWDLCTIATCNVARYETMKNSLLLICPRLEWLSLHRLHENASTARQSRSIYSILSGRLP